MAIQLVIPCYAYVSIKCQIAVPKTYDHNNIMQFVANKCNQGIYR